MKKHFIAAAVASAVAVPAAAQVTVYGTMDVGYSQIENENIATRVGTKRTNTGNGDGILSTSNLGFRGVEDLGGGLRAHFDLQFDLNDIGQGGTTTQTTANSPGGAAVNGFGARLSYVGLDGAFGTVRLGRQTSSIHSVVTAGSAGGANNMVGDLYHAGSAPGMSDNGSGVRPHTVFVDRVVTYILPKFNGVTVEGQVGKADVDDGTVATNNSMDTRAISIKYSTGPFSIALGQNEVDTLTAARAVDTEKTERAVSASYNFGPVTAFGLVVSDSIENKVTSVKTRDRSMTQIGARMPMGATTLWASTYTGDDDVEAANGLRSELEGMQLGMSYALSKRTTLYGIYGNQEMKGRDGDANTGTETKGFAAGIRHTF